MRRHPSSAARVSTLSVGPQPPRRRAQIPPEFQQPRQQTIPSGLESEYVGNLQQQLYFLELELKFLPTRELGTDAAVSLAQVEENAGADLDEAMRLLKVKYVEMEKEFNEKLDEANQRNHQLREAVVGLQMTVDQLNEEQRGLHRQFDESRETGRVEQERLLDDVAVARQRTDGVQQAADEEDAKLQQLEGEIYNLDRSIDPIKLELRKLRDDIAHLERDKADDAARMEELDQELAAVRDRIAQFEQSIAQLSTTMTERTTLLFQNEEKRLQLRGELFLVSTKLKHLEQCYAQLKEEAEALKKELTSTKEEIIQRTTELEEERVAHEELLKVNARLLTEVEAQNIETNLAITQRNRAAAKVESIQQHIDSLQQQLQETLNTGAERDATLRGLQSTLDRGKTHADGLDAQNTKLIGENRTLNETLDAITAIVQERDDHIAALTSELDTVNARNAELQKKLKVAQDLESLNVREFEAMMAHNMKVAQNIQRLMQSFAQLQGEGAQQEDTSPRAETTRTAPSPADDAPDTQENQ